MIQKKKNNFFDDERVVIKSFPLSLFFKTKSVMIVQRLKKEINGDLLIAEKYYSFLSEMNSLALTTREIQLVAFTAVKGNISNGNVREEFIKKHRTSSATINNIISKLKKLGIFVKKEGKIKVNPVISLDFSKDVILQITLSHVD